MQYSFVDMFSLYIYGIVTVFGFMIGSFLNVVIVRWPEEKSIVLPPSACPSCGYVIRWYDNIPILSYLFLMGKCRQCKKRISIRYPLIEFITGIFSLVTFLRFTGSVNAIVWINIVEYLIYFSFVAGLIVITVIDFDHHLIPDSVSLPAVPIGIIGTFFLNQYNTGFSLWKDCLLGAFLGAGSLWLVRHIYWLIRRQEGMGFGDVKMMAMIGAFLGYHPALLFVIFASSLIGSIVGISAAIFKKEGFQYEMPYGPFLAIASLLFLFFGDNLVSYLLPFNSSLD